MAAEDQDFTVFGWWADSDERYGELVSAGSARAAEEQMRAYAREEGGEFRAAATLLGEFQSADTYTGFVDPDDERNLDRCGLRAAAEADLPVDWTVIGLVESTKHGDADWNSYTGGERYLEHVMATSPRYAEDVAAAQVRERGELRLVVCAVLEGVRNRCESLPFSNPDERAEA